MSTNDASAELTPEVTFKDFDTYLGEYVGNAGKLVLLLDYDGTISPIVATPELAVIPEKTKAVLERLAVMPNILVAIVSGRNYNNVKQLVGIDSLIYAGNHGLEILFSHGKKYVHPVPEDYAAKVRNLLADLEKLCRDGAWIENKGTVLTFHYRETPEEIRSELVAEAQKLMEAGGFAVGKGHCVLEARPPVTWNKGRASLYILKKIFGENWREQVCIIYAGDDATDEDAMEALKGSAISFRVTKSLSQPTAADYRIPSTDSVLTLLEWVETHMKKEQKNDTV